MVLGLGWDLGVGEAWGQRESQTRRRRDDELAGKSEE